MLAALDYVGLVTLNQAQTPPPSLLLPLCPLQTAVRELREENERLRRDNERFVRLIDSGEWGRGRVSELVAAGAPSMRARTPHAAETAALASAELRKYIGPPHTY